MKARRYHPHRQHVELRRGGGDLEQQNEQSSIVEGAARHFCSEKTLQDSSNPELKKRVNDAWNERQPIGHTC
jgi:hypothetical protein